MSEPFWVEVLDRHQNVVSRQRAHDGKMTIGRAYENDLIVDDAFVAPLHLKIGYDEEGVLWIEDLAAHAANTDESETVTRMLVNAEAGIRIGHTSLRVRTRAYAVPPALAVVQPKKVRFIDSDEGRGFMFGAAFIALSVLATWLTQTTEFKLANYLPIAVIFPLAMVAWAGVWALVTRIITSQAQFARHVLIVFVVLVAFYFIDVATDLMAYSIVWPAPQRWLPMASWAVLGALIYAHLAVITPRHRRLAGALVAIVTVVAIGAHISLRLESDRTQPQRISAQLMPTFLLVKAPSTPDAFFKDVDALRPRLEEASKKEPVSGGSGFDDYD
ncbi:MAG: FHA domain-containing protein [Betaproteobacteria bacterium]